MLAHFSLLGVFFHSGTPLARLLGVFLLTFDFFFAFWVAPGRMFGHPGTISRVRNYFFWCFVVRAGLQCEKSAHVQKPQFSCVFVWFLHIASCVFKPQNNAKSFPGPVQQSFLQRLWSHSVLKWILEGFDALWGGT